MHSLKICARTHSMSLCISWHPVVTQHTHQQHIICSARDLFVFALKNRLNGNSFVKNQFAARSHTDRFASVCSTNAHVWRDATYSELDGTRLPWNMIGAHNTPWHRHTVFHAQKRAKMKCISNTWTSEWVNATCTKNKYFCYLGWSVIFESDTLHAHNHTLHTHGRFVSARSHHHCLTWETEKLCSKFSIMFLDVIALQCFRFGMNRIENSMRNSTMEKTEEFYSNCTVHTH